MPSRLQNLVLLDHQFDDVDELTQATKFWNLDFRQLDRGRFQGRIFQGTLGTMLIAEARFGRRLQQQGWTPSGVRTFVVPAGPAVAFTWRRRDVGPDDLLIFPRSGELESISTPGFHVFTLSLPEQELEDAAETMGVPYPKEALRSEQVRCPSLVPELRRALRRTIDRWARLSIFEVAAVQASVVRSILQVICKGTPATGPSQSTRLQDDAFVEALSLIERNERRALSVAEVCASVHASERTLRNAFRARLGLSPKAYLTARRLNGVRRDLKRAVTSGVSIGSIAADWGFSHMPQFAADYRRQFGELPSESLRRFRSRRRAGS